MKKILIALLLMLPFYSKAQNYAPLNYYFNGTPTYGVKIKTAIPFASTSHMPTLRIEGYNYGTGEVIGLNIVWYIWASDFINSSATSYGGYTPAITLSNDSGYVSIFLDAREYYQRFTISAYALGMGESATWFEDWTVEDAPLSGTNLASVSYKNRFTGTINLPSNSIWNETGLGINTSPQKPLDVAVPANDFATVGSTAMAVGQYAGLHFGYRENGTSLYRKSAIVFERTDNGGGGSNAAGKVHILNGPSTGQNSATLADAKLTINEYGNVGIGTTSPAANLQVVGTTFINTSSQLYGISQARLTVAQYANTGDWTVAIKGATASSSSFGMRIDAGSNSSDYALYVQNTSASAMFTIRGDGNVGVGMSNPGTYKLNVCGKIRANEVKVDLAGCDFVFASDYKLMSLKDLEKFINANKHLPEIQPAAEMEKDGTDLGELNSKLLQKVEELTLYIIEQNKRIETLEVLVKQK